MVPRASRCRRTPWAGSTRWQVVVAVAFLVGWPCSVSAQSSSVGSADDVSITPPDSTWLVQDPAARACLDTVSAASLRPVTVYQIANPSDTSEFVLAQVALISQRVAEGVRAALGGGRDLVSSADTLVPWRHLAGRVPIRMALHREAATTWSADSSADPAKTKLTSLYASVLRAMPADQLEIVWPDQPVPDSITVLFELTNTDSTKTPLAIPGYPMMSVFRTRGVGFTPAMVRPRGPYPLYPSDAVASAVEAEVVMDIVVSPSGRANGTMRSVVISSRRNTLDGDARARYGREFTSSVEQALRRMQFDPARVGGCAVPQQAKYPFTFGRG